MRNARLLFVLAAAAVAALPACRRDGGPRALLVRYFDSARRGDYAATWECYDGAYQAKVSRDEYVRHRKDAAPLERYEVVSLDQREDRARARVALVFGPAPGLGRTVPASTLVEEDLVRERGGWRIRVW
jgi:hypothetical protein